MVSVFPKHGSAVAVMIGREIFIQNLKSLLLLWWRFVLFRHWGVWTVIKLKCALHLYTFPLLMISLSVFSMQTQPRLFWLHLGTCKTSQISRPSNTTWDPLLDLSPSELHDQILSSAWQTWCVIKYI